jgi:hypothetical protein
MAIYAGASLAAAGAAGARRARDNNAARSGRGFHMGFTEF